MTCAQIQLPSDASELASSSNWVLGPVLGSAGIGLSPGYSVAIACAWAHSAPLMGIPNLLPFPIHPNFRLSLTWTHSSSREDQKKQLLPPGLPFPPKLPLSRALSQLQKSLYAPAELRGRYYHQSRFYASAFTSQIPSLQLGERFAGCWRSFIIYTFTSRQRPVPKYIEQRKPFSAIINEKTFTPRTESFKCFESMVSENNRSNIWYWEGEKPLPQAISQKYVPQGFTLALRKKHKKTR